MVIISIVIALVVILLFLSLRVVKEYDRGVIFFLGKATGIRGPGLIILIPIFELMTKVTLRTITMAHPLAEDHHQGQRLYRHRGGRLLSHRRPDEGSRLRGERATMP